MIRATTSLRNMRNAVITFAMACSALQAQQAGSKASGDGAPIPSYELVSIHKTPETQGESGIGDKPDGFEATGTTLRSLIGEAYGFSLGSMTEQQLVGAPAWAKTEKFDVRAEVDAEDVPRLAQLAKAETMMATMATVRQMVTRTPSYRMVMLQRLLEDRFKVKVHYEQRVMPLYELTLAKGGVRMKEAHAADPEHGSMQFSHGKLQGENVPMAFIPLVFEMELQRPVQDKTGKDGNFDFEMHWSGMENESQASGSDETGPSLFTAVQEQMGLKLAPGKGPVWVIVVDHAEMPSEN